MLVVLGGRRDKPNIEYYVKRNGRYSRFMTKRQQIKENKKENGKYNG